MLGILGTLGTLVSWAIVVGVAVVVIVGVFALSAVILAGRKDDEAMEAFVREREALARARERDDDIAPVTVRYVPTIDLPIPAREEEHDATR